jgi:predicted DsbA family dithiol-disulfide isomerase
MPSVALDIWSDYVCPFCRLVQPAVARLRAELGDSVRVTWRAFELRPEPTPSLDENREYFARLFRAGILPRAAESGLTMHFPPKHPRTRRAHALTA